MPTPVAEGRMAGFVKLWRSDEPAGRWQDAYAVMDDRALCFYHHDQDALQGAPPFQVGCRSDLYRCCLIIAVLTSLQSVELAHQQWRMRLQAHADDEHALRQHDKPFLVEVKITVAKG